jgi:hypothetical protein
VNSREDAVGNFYWELISCEFIPGQEPLATLVVHDIRTNRHDLDNSQAGSLLAFDDQHGLHDDNEPPSPPSQSDPCCDGASPITTTTTTLTGADDDYYVTHVTRPWLHKWQRRRAPSSRGDPRAALSCSPLPYADLPGDDTSSPDANASAPTSATAAATPHERNRSRSPTRPLLLPSRQPPSSPDAKQSSSCGGSHAKERPTLPMMSTAASSSSTSVPVLAVIFPQPPPELAISPVPEAVECEQCDVGANAFCCYCYSALCLQCFETHHCGMTKLTSSFDGRCIECSNQADKRCLRCVHPVCYYCTSIHNLYRHNA